MGSWMRTASHQMKNRSSSAWCLLLSSASVVLILSACSSPSFGDQLIQTIKRCGSNPCSVDLKKVYPTDWTDIYIVDGVMEPSEVSKVIGRDCKCEMVYDGAKLIIFIDSAGGVSSHKEPTANLVFTNAYSNGMVHITQDHPLFEVETAEVGEQKVYRLTRRCSGVP